MKDKLLSPATELNVAEIQTENRSLRKKENQDHRERQNQTHALRQTPSHGHQGPRPHAQAKETDAGQSQGRRRRQANAPLRLEPYASSSFEFRFSILDIVPGSASRVPAGR